MWGGRFRRWIACILPFGALDIVRVVHINGRVEEYGGPISAGGVLRANPGHILSLPCSHAGLPPRVVISSHSSVLKRGHIYFLVPHSMVVEEEEWQIQKKKTAEEEEEKKKNKNKMKDYNYSNNSNCSSAASTSDVTDIPVVRRQLGHRRCRSVPVALWKPQLEQISEDPLKHPLPEEDEKE